MRNTNLPKRCLNTTNTSRSGAHITSRWSSAWSELNAALAGRKVSAISARRLIRNSFLSFGKHGLISAANMTIRDVRLRSEVMTKEIKYITTADGERIAVIIPLEQ